MGAAAPVALGRFIDSDSLLSSSFSSQCHAVPYIHYVWVS